MRLGVGRKNAKCGIFKEERANERIADVCHYVLIEPQRMHAPYHILSSRLHTIASLTAILIFLVLFPRGNVHRA